MLSNIEDGLIMIPCQDGLADVRSRDYQMGDYWRRNEDLRPRTIVKDALLILDDYTIKP